MRNDHHTIFGINCCYAVLQSKKYKIMEILIQSGSQAEKDGKITHLLGYHGGHIKILPSTQFKSNFNQWRTQGIVVRFSGKIDSNLPSYNDKNGNDKYVASGSVVFKHENKEIICDKSNYWPNGLDILSTLSGKVAMKDDNSILKCNQLILFHDDINKYKAISKTKNKLSRTNKNGLNYIKMKI